jgi:hypothetical protein
MTLLLHQVVIGKTAASVLKEYKSDVLPVLEDFVDKDLIGLFNQRANLNQVSSGIQKAVSRRVTRHVDHDPSHYEAIMSSFIDIGILCASRTSKEYAMEYVERLKATTGNAK